MEVLGTPPDDFMLKISSESVSNMSDVIYAIFKSFAIKLLTDFNVVFLLIACVAFIKLKNFIRP